MKSCFIKIDLKRLIAHREPSQGLTMDVATLRQSLKEYVLPAQDNCYRFAANPTQALMNVCNGNMHN
jgi:hypothetical protein